MGGLIAALLLVAVLAVAAAVWLAVRPDSGHAGAGPSGESWPKRAVALVDRGWMIADELDVSRRADPSPSIDAGQLDRIDAFIADLAALTTAAPTSVDRRVCRVVATKSWVLRRSVERTRCGTATAGGTGTSERPLDASYAEFRLALHDLSSHLDVA